MDYGLSSSGCGTWGAGWLWTSEYGTSKTVNDTHKTVNATYKTVKAAYKTVKATYKTVKATYKTFKAMHKTVKATYKTVMAHIRQSRPLNSSIDCPGRTRSST